MEWWDPKQIGDSVVGCIMMNNHNESSEMRQSLLLEHSVTIAQKRWEELSDEVSHLQLQDAIVEHIQRR